MGRHGRSPWGYTVDRKNLYLKGAINMENKKLHPKYETGKLGLSRDELKAEKKQIEEAICARSVDEDGNHPGIAYTWFCTPQEVHRLRVLDAIEMANCCLCYGYGWNHYSSNYLLSDNSSNPKITEELRQAHALTLEELDAIYKGQQERMKHAVIKKNVFTDDEGCSYNSIDWDVK